MRLHCSKTIVAVQGVSGTRTRDVSKCSPPSIFDPGEECASFEMWRRMWDSKVQTVRCRARHWTGRQTARPEPRSAWSACVAFPASWAGSNCIASRSSRGCTALSQQYDITIIGRKPYIPGGAYEYQGLRVVPLPAIKNKYLEAITNTTLAVFYARFALKAEILHIHGIGPALLGPLGPPARHEAGRHASRPGFRAAEMERHRQGGAAPRRALRDRGGEPRHRGVEIGDRGAAPAPSEDEGADRLHPERRDRVSGRRCEEDAQRGAERVRTRAGRNTFSASAGLCPEKGFHDLIAAFQAREPRLQAGDRRRGRSRG